MKNSSNVIFALFLGAIIGAVCFFLYNPKSGEKNRKKLKKMARKQRKQFQTQMDNLKQQAEDISTKAKETVNANSNGKFEIDIDELAESANGVVTDYTNQAKSVLN